MCRWKKAMISISVLLFEFYFHIEERERDRDWEINIGNAIGLISCICHDFSTNNSNSKAFNMH